MAMNSLRAKSGQLLLEILLAIGISAVVIGLGAGLVYIGLSGIKTSSEINTAVDLSNTIFRQVQAAAFGDWKDIADLSKGPANPHHSEVDTDEGVSYKWISHPISGTTWSTTSINGVSALSPKNVWIVGNNSYVWNWDGFSWKQF